MPVTHSVSAKPGSVQKPLYIARIETLEEKDIPFWVFSIQHADLSKNWDTGIKTLVTAIKKLDNLPETCLTPAEQNINPAPPPIGWRRIVLVFKKGLDWFRPRLDKLAEKLRNLLNLSWKFFRLVFAESGSTRVVIDILQESATLLLHIIEERPDYFAEFELESAKIVSEQVHNMRVGDLLAINRDLDLHIAYQGVPLAKTVDYASFVQKGLLPSDFKPVTTFSAGIYLTRLGLHG